MGIDFFAAGGKRRNPALRRELLSRAATGGGFTEDYLRYGYDYFDNPALGVGYGGYAYDGRFASAALGMCEHYGLMPGQRVLEVGCAKGYLLVEFHRLGLMVSGADISAYALANAHEDIRHAVIAADIASLPFPDRAFDLVIAKEILPHVAEANLDDAIGECARVTAGALFLEIQCGVDEDELACLKAWDATHATLRTPEWWRHRFACLDVKLDVNFRRLFAVSE